MQTTHHSLRARVHKGTCSSPNRNVRSGQYNSRLHMRLACGKRLAIEVASDSCFLRYPDRPLMCQRSIATVGFCPAHAFFSDNKHHKRITKFEIVSANRIDHRAETGIVRAAYMAAQAAPLHIVAKQMRCLLPSLRAAGTPEQSTIIWLPELSIRIPASCRQAR